MQIAELQTMLNQKQLQLGDQTAEIRVLLETVEQVKLRKDAISASSLIYVSSTSTELGPNEWPI